eukprot:g2609.t1
MPEMLIEEVTTEQQQQQQKNSQQTDQQPPALDDPNHDPDYDLPVDFDAKRAQEWIAKTNCLDKEELMQFMQNLKDEHNEGDRIKTSLWDAVGANDVSRVEAILETSDAKDQINRKSPDWDHQTALHRAASSGYAKIVRALLKRGARLGERDAGGSSALHLACTHQQTEVAGILLEKGAATNSRDTEGQTPLMIAAGGSSSDLVDLLIKHGAKPMMPDAAGYTALHSAAASGRLDTTQKFLQTCDAKAVNTADLDGLTPLHVASAGGYEDVVRLLLDSGADVHLRCKMGRTAQDWAEEEFEDEVKAILEQHAATAPPPVEAAEAAGSDAVAGGSSSSSVVGLVEEAQQAVQEEFKELKVAGSSSGKNEVEEEEEKEEKEKNAEVSGAEKAKASIAEMQRHAEGLISALGGMAVAPAQAAPEGTSEGGGSSSGSGSSGSGAAEVDLSAPIGTDMELLD